MEPHDLIFFSIYMTRQGDDCTFLFLRQSSCRKRIFEILSDRNLQVDPVLLKPVVQEYSTPRKSDCSTSKLIVNVDRSLLAWRGVERRLNIRLIIISITPALWTVAP
ncbi:hypothetical protein AVEN_183261-1 [Araneus ventricosus]|uniref:Uncharacterized protein n=1 Tax=Araneus ventricosus TaxID=182803 RepID=A0A4Y2LMV7_ARAVE|nr:hypothetical protein AVEN_183261-1 [Araneus ventricosus]